MAASPGMLVIIINKIYTFLITVLAFCILQITAAQSKNSMLKLIVSHILWYN